MCSITDNFTSKCIKMQSFLLGLHCSPHSLKTQPPPNQHLQLDTFKFSKKGFEKSSRGVYVFLDTWIQFFCVKRRGCSVQPKQDSGAVTGISVNFPSSIERWL